MNIKNILMVLLFGWLLAACSGDPLPQDDETDDGDETLVEDGDQTSISYLSLMTVDKYKEWSLAAEDEILRSYEREPEVYYYTINPVDAKSLEPISNAKASDYDITYDGIPINPNVSFPMLQKIIGNQIDLRTAIVINTSTAMDVVDRAEFIQEIKDYVTAAKESDVYFIREQKFTVWAVDGVAVETTDGATAIETEVHAAINAVETGWGDGSYATNGANHLYDGVIEAIGRFAGESEFSVGKNYNDTLTADPDDNDLKDYVTPDFIGTSSVVVFSAGFSTPNAFGENDFKRALESQSTYTYSPASDDSVDDQEGGLELTASPKPMIYVVPDGESADDIVSGLAHTIVENTISGGEYSFANDVVDAQFTAISERAALGNQHVLRWANPVRAGETHKQVVKTRTGDDQFGYEITRDIKFGNPGIEDEPMPDPQVEITGADNEYLATNVVIAPELGVADSYDSARTFANLISTFYPATRWTNQEFSSSDYTWSFTPAGSMTQNSDGSISITDVNSNDFPITLTLTNNNITHDGITISDDFVLTIEKTNQ